MSGSRIDLVHLVWSPLGTEPFARFVEAYRAHPAGCDHRLVLVLKEFRDASHLAPWDALADGLIHERIEMPQPALDLAAYRRVAGVSDSERLCLTNSSSAPRAGEWLEKLDDALGHLGVGAAAATGSWESTYTSAPVWLKPLRVRSFPPFPNPHLRTNALVLDRDLLLDLDWPDVGLDKQAALRLENGRRSISRQIEERGMRTVVAGRDGRVYGSREWPVSRTFRSGRQENLLVADNRTRQYDAANPARRAELARFAWGDQAA